MINLPEEKTLALLPIVAKKAIESHWVDNRESETYEELQSPAATFVTLTKEGQLRGCIGSLQAHRALVEDVRHNARAAAFHDPRFPPVREEELKDLDIEVSVLTEPVQVNFDSEESLFAQIRPGIDGVVIESGFHRATFLPQVWEQLPTHNVFFRQLLAKAGLPGDTVLTDLSVSTYQVKKIR